MELRLTVHVPHRRPRPLEITVSAVAGTDVGELRAALRDHLAMAVPSIAVGGVRLQDRARLGAPPLLDGQSVVVAGDAHLEDGDPDAAGARPVTVLEVACVSGPDAGRSLPLTPAGLDVGRSPGSGLRLDDPTLSRRHAHLAVDESGVLVHDLGATNGVIVDGVRISGRAPVDTSTTLTIGSSTLRLRRSAGAGLPVEHPGDGTALLRPGGRAAPPESAARVEAPRRPEPPARGRVPWIAALVPVPVFVVMAFFLGPYLLAFALVGPVVLLATAAGDRVTGRRRHRAALSRWSDERSTARAAFARALDLERRDRHAAHPDLHAALRSAERRLPGLWSACDELTVRVGVGDLTARSTWVEDGEELPGVAEGVPVVVDLTEHRTLGVVGPPQRTRPILVALLGQLVTRYPPTALGVRAPADGDWSWVGRLPHRDGGPCTVHVVPDSCAPDLRTDEAATTTRTVMLVAATRRADLPDGCTAVVECTGGGGFTLDTTADRVTGVADGAGGPWAERLSRALAPLRVAGATDTRLPGAVSLLDLVGIPATPEDLRAAWEASTGPCATVGSTATGPMRIDLRSDGPHLLVGGTTGSGKSEFLRTLVTALALASPPEQLTMLLVDFKGGAAFGACARLPHVVGVVTDLDEHLVGRVLRSLDAELRRRERLFAESGAGDLEDHLARRPADPVPRLVIVVDELRALVDEQPEALRGLVRLAAQGRSLGIHLVLATQRPSGTLTPEVQANVNLRIAFRVRDHADSVGVVETGDAALLSSETPGRGVARGGDGRLLTFQAALVRPREVSARVSVRDTGATPACEDAADRAAQTAAVVDMVRSCHAGLGGVPARRPWLPPLPDVVDADAEPSAAFALVDEPDHQRRSPWTWTPSVPLWRVVGRPRSGRSTALASIVAAACHGTRPTELHVHAISPSRPAWARLPHVGAVVGPHDRPGVAALLEHLATRRSSGTSGPATLLVVDGWEQLSELDDPRDLVPTSEELVRLLRDGAGSGLVAAVSGGRDLLRPRWSALGGETLLLGQSDPVDLALLGLSTPDLPTEPPPGRGVRAADGREVQVLRPAPPTGDSRTDPGPVASSVAPGHPWTYRPLPTVVTRTALDVQADVDGLLLGVSAPDGRPLLWRPAEHGRRLLVTGPARSGRTTALRVLATSAEQSGWPVALVSSRTDPGPGRHAVIGPEDADRLAELRHRHPDLLVLVDDADRLDSSPLSPLLNEICDLVDRDAGAIVVASTTATLRGRFRGLDVGIARHGVGLLLHAARGDEALLGASRLPVLDDPAPPGRGVLVRPGGVRAMQVLADRTHGGQRDVA